MPRFFFHVHDDVDAYDDEGVHLADRPAARAAALAAARAMICDQVRKGRLSLHYRIEVEDERRQPVFTLTFADAVRSSGTELNRNQIAPPSARIADGESSAMRQPGGDEAGALRALAEQCRRLAAGASRPELAASLNYMAEDYERQAGEAETAAKRPATEPPNPA